MVLDNFIRAMQLVVELQNIVDNEVRLHKNGHPKASKEILELSSKLSCIVSDTYDGLLEYVSHDRVE